jgi:hypothetical protein
LRLGGKGQPWPHAEQGHEEEKDSGPAPPPPRRREGLRGGDILL